jgi:uncharacterized protein YdcH (DUF465 family)
MKTHRDVPSEKQIERLARKHAELDAEVSQIESKIHLSSDDEVHVRRLKKEKLRAKDALRSVRREL